MPWLEFFLPRIPDLVPALLRHSHATESRRCASSPSSHDSSRRIQPHRSRIIHHSPDTILCKMPYATPEDLDKFDPQRAGRYDPGEIQVFYDNRNFGGFKDKMPLYQKYKLQALSKLGRPDIWSITDLPGGHLRIIFFTVSAIYVHAKTTMSYPIPSDTIPHHLQLQHQRKRERERGIQQSLTTT